MDSSYQLPPHQIDTTSTRLLRRVAADEAGAWKQFVQIYGPVVRHWILRSGVSRSYLPDVFQNVFIAVLRNIGAFERQDGQAKFRAWLKMVTISKVNDHRRRNRNQPMAQGGTTAVFELGNIEAPDLEDDNDDESLASSEEAFVIQRTLQIVRKEFRDKSWTAFQRTAIDGLDATEVAEELGMTSLAVRKAKSRVMQRLKEILGSHSDSMSADPNQS